MIATNTPLHREHSMMMIQAGQRVFLEKPLTGTLKAIENLQSCLSASIHRD